MKPLIDPALFDFSPHHLWLLHCAEGPIPKPSARAIEAMVQKELCPWELDFAKDFLGLADSLRENAARCIGAQPQDISLTQSTSSGLTTLAQTFPWQEGDEVLAPMGEFPSNVWPWKALESRGVRYRSVPLWPGHQCGDKAWQSTAPSAQAPIEQTLLEAIGPKTRVLALSWVRFQDGLMLDLKTLAQGCQSRGVALVVDGVQGAGTCPLNVQGISAFVTGGHKGLLGPSGQGFFWTEPSFRAQLRPAGSWLSVEDSTNFARASTDYSRAWRSDGVRMEQGNYNLLGCAALRASLELLNSVGVQQLWTHIRLLQAELLQKLEQLPPWKDEARRLTALYQAERLGPTLSLHHQGKGPEFLQSYFQKGQAKGLFSSVREGYLRIAFHGWHQSQDLQQVVQWLGA